MRAFDRDLIRGGHYGQRSCEPRKQAEHMAAPTQLQTCRKPLPTWSSPHMAHMRRTSSARAGPVVGPNRTFFHWPATSQFDAADGAPSAASKCHKVVALRQ